MATDYFAPFQNAMTGATQNLLLADQIRQQKSQQRNQMAQQQQLQQARQNAFTNPDLVAGMRTLGSAGDIQGLGALSNIGTVQSQQFKSERERNDQAAIYARRIASAPEEMQPQLYEIANQHLGATDAPPWESGGRERVYRVAALTTQPQELSLTETGEGFAYLPKTIKAGEKAPSAVRVEGVLSPKALSSQQNALKEAKEAKKTDFKNANDLRDEYNTQSKTFISVRDSYGRVLESANNPSAAGDLALIFNYMKMLDPGSVVRESEFANAASTGAYGERIKAAVGKIITGERLSDAMRNDFIDRSKKLFNRTRQNQDSLKSEYSRLAKGFGVDPRNVIVDYSLQGIQQPPQQTGGIKFLGFE